MKKSRTPWVMLFAAALAAPVSGALAAWPEKPVKLIVPFPPGGNTDSLGRLAAQQLTESLGQPVIVENRPGVGSMLGSQAVARAEPDGYTLLVGSIANVTGHYVYKKPLLDIGKDLIPVSQLVAVPNYLAASPDSPFSTVQDVVAYAKANPDQLSCATTGVGTSPYMSCELFKSLAGVKIINVPYKGGADAMTSAMGKQASMVFANEALPFIQGKRLKGLGVTTGKRSPLAPGLPAIAETIPGYDVTSWYGVFAPAGTPPAIVNKLSAEMTAMLKKPDILEKLRKLGADPVGSTPEQFSAYVRAELKRWGGIIRPMNIQLD
jgi:tripartite-type tricarboxylate transporter receptor subunit TctC